MAIQFRVKSGDAWAIKATFERINPRMQDLVRSSKIQLFNPASGEIVAESYPASLGRFDASMADVVRAVA